MTADNPATLDDARAALDRIADPVSGQGLVAAGLVQGLVVRNGRAGFMLEVPANQAATYPRSAKPPKRRWRPCRGSTSPRSC